MVKLAIVTTHPIQYNAPLFALLTRRGIIRVRIFYTWGEAVLQNKYDPGFEKSIEWDIPLLEGYDHIFVKNISSRPGSHHFSGIDNPGLIKAIEEWKADAVLVYGWALRSHLKAMRFFHNKIPVIFRGDSTMLGEISSIKKALRKILLKWVYSRIDIALYVGTNNRHYFLHYGLKPEQLEFAPHAIDNDRFALNEDGYVTAAAAWREKLNIGAGDLVFLFAAKLTPDKNAELLIRSFLSLKQNDIHLLVAGSGEQKKYLEDTYAREPGIHFLPFQNQSMMPVLYRVGDVFVLPSKSNSETWGLSINEAMACSRPVLASDKCGAAIDLIKDGHNGYVFKSNDVDDLTNKLNLFIKNKSQLSVMGMRAREYISSWSFESTCEKIEKTVILASTEGVKGSGI